MWLPNFQRFWNGRFDSTSSVLAARRGLGYPATIDITSALDRYSGQVQAMLDASDIRGSEQFQRDERVQPSPEQWIQVFELDLDRSIPRASRVTSCV